MNNDSPRIIQSARPLFLRGTNNTAVLLIHGWTGYPGQHYFLAEALNKQGYTVAVPRLPGHGSTTADFLSARGADWIRKAEDAYMELSVDYPRTVPVGVSMGALLALHIGARWKVPGIGAAAPAVSLKNRFAHFAPWIHPFISEIPLSPEEKEGKKMKKRTDEGDEKKFEDPDEEYIREQYWSARYPSAVAQFLKVRRKVLKELSLVEAPLYIVETEQDEMVTLRSGQFIQEKSRSAKVDRLLLKESKHQVFNGTERETVASGLITWLDSLE